MHGTQWSFYASSGRWSQVLQYSLFWIRDAHDKVESVVRVSVDGQFFWDTSLSIFCYSETTFFLEKKCISEYLGIIVNKKIDEHFHAHSYP